MRHRLVLMCVAALGLLHGSNAGAQTGFTTVRFMVGGEPRWAGLWVPPDAPSGTNRPLIVYLHGGSGRGESRDSRAVQEWLTSLEVAKAIQEHPERFPALVLMPRLPGGAYWTPVLPGSWAPDAVTRRTSDTVGVVELNAAIDAVLAGYSVDRARISLTGKSLGGGGTYGFAALHPDRFSAIAPVAGFGSQEQARAVASIPAWVFHGDADTTIPSENAHKMVRAIQDAGGSVRFTEYPGVTHSSAEVERRTYRDPEVISWLLAQRRSVKP